MRQFLMVVALLATSLVHADELRVVNSPATFPIATPGGTTTFVYDAANDHEVVGIAANAVAGDIDIITGQRPNVVTSLGDAGSTPVIAGTIGRSTIIDALISAGKLDVSAISGKWEAYSLQVIIKPQDGIQTALVIAGSTPRGTAYGLFELSRLMGVSPWVWWADVAPEPRTALYATEGTLTVGEPSVKFRGIFINDEDWGIQPWAAKNMDTDIKDMGPNTYARICELLLRLRANILWPAMHDCTKAFWYYVGNPEVAKKYDIVLGSSHCEPMLVNNAAQSEWDSKVDGEWNYQTNRDNIYRKFDKRLSETAQYDNIYTTGMRGLHDAAMIGPKDPKQRAVTLEKVISDQREILERRKGKPAAEIPQIFVPYKEALDVYDAGLKVPEDITLVWPDDNYGYMKRVSNEQERRRSGHSGIYYHISYLGAPHDNLWIATTAPVLMYEELKKAYDSGADRYWLLNVGDIKPMELEMQQFFDMAWELGAFDYEKARLYQANWLEESKFRVKGSTFQEILDKYYQLAWQRKPEFMGYEWEWDTPENSRLHDSGFSFTDGTAQQRLADYKRISDQVDSIEKALPEAYRPAFFEMLGYSVKGAYQMNRKFLMAQLNHETGSAEAAREAKEAYDSIQALTVRYNTQLDGKWNQMMSQIPPGLRAKYQLMPELTDVATDAYRAGLGSTDLVVDVSVGEVQVVVVDATICPYGNLEVDGVTTATIDLIMALYLEIVVGGGGGGNNKEKGEA